MMTGAGPLLSVVIPTFNRADRLRACLDALAGQTFREFEVVVVDDGSAEPMSTVVEPFTDRLSLHCVRQVNAGPAAARNHGARLARGRFLAFTDDDCRPRPDWLAALAAACEAAPDALIGGRSDNAIEGSVCSGASQDLVSFLYDHALSSPDGFDFFTSNNMACAREAFLRLGGFDESFPLAAGEDREFGLRWKRTGGALKYCEAARVDHHHALNLRGFWRQQSNYGRGAAQLRRRFNERRDKPVPFAGVGFYAGLVTYPFRAHRPQSLRRSGLLVLSQVAMVAGYLDAVRRRPTAR